MQRHCSPVERYPAILTDKEKRDTDNDPKYENTYDSNNKNISCDINSDVSVLEEGCSAIKSPNKDYWFICPEVWCPNCNKSYKLEQIGNDKICPNENCVLRTELIFRKTSDLNNWYNWPNYMIVEKNGNNIFLPCCFKNPTNKGKGSR